MTESKEKSIMLNIRLKPVDHSDQPHTANCTNLGVAQHIAYLDFGFVEPAALAAIAKTQKDGHAVSKGLDGALVTRVAMGVDVLNQLYQQIQQVLIGIRSTTPSKRNQ